MIVSEGESVTAGAAGVVALAVSFSVTVKLYVPAAAVTVPAPLVQVTTVAELVQATASGTPAKADVVTVAGSGVKL